MISLTDPSFLLLLSQIAGSVLLVVVAAIMPSNKTEGLQDVIKWQDDFQKKQNQLINAHNSLTDEVSNLKSSGLPKGFYDNINLDQAVENLKDEELDSEIHSLDEIQEQNARVMIILNRNYKALEARRVAAHRTRTERDLSNLPAVKQKAPDQPIESEAPNPFPFLQSKA